MKNIIVTGGAGTLGRAVVKQLTAEGHRVAVVDLTQIEPGYGAQFLGGVDLADDTAVQHAFASIATGWGGEVDGLANIAGGFVWETIADGSAESFDVMFRKNLRTAAVASRAALPYLSAPGASIVNVGAAAAASAAVGMAAYAASKAGVMALTESFADELKGRGIRVNAVLPTVLDTPANRRDMPTADTSYWVKPQAAARVIAFLLSSDSGAVTGVGLRLSLAGES